jgi:hypothetical protein
MRADTPMMVAPIPRRRPPHPETMPEKSRALLIDCSIDVVFPRRLLAFAKCIFAFVKSPLE